MPFPLGRPLGVPGDADFQHRVLDAALALLEHSGGPIFVDYDEDVPQARRGEDIWVCPVAFDQVDQDASIASQVLREIALLQPWYDKGRRSGSTSMGVSGMTLNEAVRFVAGFVEAMPIAKMSASKSSKPDLLKYAVEDIKAFYNEAAASQPGTATVQEMEDWYWGETAAGKMVRAVKTRLINDEDRALQTVAAYLLVPRSQAFRDLT